MPRDPGCRGRASSRPTHGVLFYGLGHNLGRSLEGLGIGDGIGTLPSLIDNEGLETLGAHHCAQTSPPCRPAGAPVNVRALYGSRGESVITRRPDAEYRGLLSVSLKDLFREPIGPHGLVVRGRDESCFPLFIYPKKAHFSFRGLTLYDDRPNPQTAKGGRYGSSSIALFDAPGERAFGSYGDSVGVDQGGVPLNRPGAKMSLFSGPRGVTSRRDLFVDHDGCQPSATQYPVFRWHIFNLNGLLAHV